MRLTLILDPNIFFQCHEGRYYIHPIISNWLEDIKNKLASDSLHIYLLVKEDYARLDIKSGNKTIDLPIGDIFFSLLHPEAMQYLSGLWTENRIQFADVSCNSPTGIFHLSDHHEIVADEIMIVTADNAIKSLFESKKIPVAYLPETHLPVSELVDVELLTNNTENKFSNQKTEVYCDFDGTFFDADDLMLLNYTDHIEVFSENDIKALNTISDLKSKEGGLHLVYQNTIKLLLYFSQHPIYLATQRNHDIDSVQPYYNSVAKIIKRINEENNLKIDVDPSRFYSACTQLTKTADSHEKKQKPFYVKKLEHIYCHMDKIRSPEERPSIIIFIDDSIEEHLKTEQAKEYFKKLDITLIPILITNILYYTAPYIEVVKQLIPSLFAPLMRVIAKNESALTKALEAMKERQEIAMLELQQQQNEMRQQERESKQQEAQDWLINLQDYSSNVNLLFSRTTSPVEEQNQSSCFRTCTLL